MSEDIGKEIEPFARKAKSLLNSINKELSTIPEYKSAKFARGESKREPSRLDAIPDAITALRRGIRLLKGKESKPSLVKKKRKLQSFLNQAEELKGAKLIEGTSTILYK